MDKNYNPNYTVRRLEEGETVKSFDCGDADLNDFILNAAPLYRNELLAISYVMEDENGKTLAYFSLANQLIRFIKLYFRTDNKTGCRFITVDAYINAIPFYLKNEFRPMTEADKDDTHTRVLLYDLKRLEG
ncbi:MAG TPA: GNAT family N-acetyltransferase [Candidatus Bacteroides merdigallinarum]|uniref:GNAT family N-acetyltransferase n=1 Tax=Candidatus Bacteroides merdigallinarum TaxID=2838473 RepID=A0A9D2J0S6_9BACE|nr:GNAT family N-acetyltransferase [Candidatus Bacteroides merdigallinarum]